MSHTLLSKSKSGQGRCSHTRGLTLPSRGRVPAGFARFHTPLTSNVSPHVQSSAIANHTACIGAAVLHRSSSAPSPARAVRAAAATAAAAAFERACVRSGRALRQSLKCKHKLRCKFSLPFQHGLASHRRAARFAFEQHARAHLSQPVLPQGMQASPHIIGQGRAFVLHRANPSVEGTANGEARLRASATMAAPLSAPHFKR